MNSFKKIISISVIIAFISHLIKSLYTLDGFSSYFLNFQYFGISFIYSFVITVVMVLFHNYLNQQLQWKTHPKTKLIVGTLGAVALILFIYILGQLIHHVIITKTTTLEEFRDQFKFKNYIFTLLFSLVIILLFNLIGFLKAFQKQKIEEQKTIANLAKSQYTALKNQLDPHFLFNSLNVLTALINENPEQAEKFTTKLSKIYRYVLEEKQNDVVSIQKELQFAKNYIAILQMRFEDSLVFTVEKHVLENSGSILPLSLQLLLENAIKHNSISTNAPLEISIYISEQYLIVQNNFQPKNNKESSTKVGLSNIEKRYRTLTNIPFVTEMNKHTFIAKLPIL